MNTNFREYFKGKKVLIMGLGILGGGVGVAKFLGKLRAKVTVTDLKTEKELAWAIQKLKGLPIRYVFGRHEEKDFLNSDLIIRNPDVDQNSPFLQLARRHQVPVEMDESLFLRFCPVPVIGVTGTRGKTTTTYLIGEVFKTAGFPVVLGGNVPGVATLSLLAKINPKTKVVLELSSWQLQGLDWVRISPHIAVVTNIYPDHLNRYPNMAAYIADKKLIFKYQKKDDYLVLNREDDVTGDFAKEAKGKVVWFKKRDWSTNWPLKLLGDHNRVNAAAALVVGKLFGIDEQIIRKAVGNFPGLPHRLEFVRKVGGVTFINDSASTMPEAGMAALQAFRGQSIILICGGNSKNLDLTDFAKEIAQRVKATVLLEGTATNELERAMKQCSNVAMNKLILGRFNNFKKAILVAKKQAKPGDVILLSPGCTSFGMFKNEFDRGEKFKEIVKKLKDGKKIS